MGVKVGGDGVSSFLQATRKTVQTKAGMMLRMCVSLHSKLPQRRSFPYGFDQLALFIVYLVGYWRDESTSPPMHIGICNASGSGIGVKLINEVLADSLVMSFTAHRQGVSRVQFSWVRIFWNESRSNCKR